MKFLSADRTERPVRISLGAAAIMALALASCDGAPSAGPARGHAAGEGAAPTAAVRGSIRGRRAGRETDRPIRPVGCQGRPDADAPLLVDGKPIWAANRNHSSQDNADYQYEKERRRPWSRQRGRLHRQGA